MIPAYRRGGTDSRPTDSAGSTLAPRRIVEKYRSPDPQPRGAAQSGFAPGWNHRLPAESEFLSRKNGGRRALPSDSGRGTATVAWCADRTADGGISHSRRAEGAVPGIFQAPRRHLESTRGGGPVRRPSGEVCGARHPRQEAAGEPAGTVCRLAEGGRVTRLDGRARCESHQPESMAVAPRGSSHGSLANEVPPGFTR